MKRIALLGAVALLIAAASCENKASDVAAALTPAGASADLFSKGISVNSGAGSIKLTFNSAKEWSVETEETKAFASWLSVIPASGKAGENTVTVYVQENDKLADRKAKISFISDAVKLSVNLTQGAREAIAITSVNLDKTEISLYAGETETLQATVLPTYTDDDKTVTWTSSNDKVATVSDGVVTAVAEGEATVTAAAGGKTATCKVTVLHTVIEVESVSLDQTEASLFEGETLTLQATVNPSNADEAANLTWTSSDETVATVKDGVVTAVAMGKAVITVTCSGKSATCALTVDKKGSHGEDLGDPVNTNPWN